MFTHKMATVVLVAMMASATAVHANGSDRGHSNGNGHDKNGSVTNVTNKGGRGGNAYAGAIAGAKGGNATIERGAVNNQNKNINHNVATGGSARQAQGQLQGQLQGQAQQQKTRQANEQSMTYNESEGVHYSGGYEVENVPDAYAASIQPTTPCAIPLTGAGSGVGFGISLGTAYVDRECEIRETVRLGLNSSDARVKRLANDVLISKLEEMLSTEVEEDVSVNVNDISSDEDVASMFHH